MYARSAGQDRRLPSIQLCIEAGESTCAFNYTCIYSEMISWVSPFEPLPMVANPPLALELLFGDASVAPERGSVLDAIAPAASRLQRDLGSTNRVRLNAYLEDVRGIERRIELTERDNAAAVSRVRVGAPLGVPDSWAEHVKMMFDLQVLLSPRLLRESRRSN